MRRQQAMKPEHVALGFGKGGSLIGQRVAEQGARGGMGMRSDDKSPLNDQKRRLSQPAKKSELA